MCWRLTVAAPAAAADDVRAALALVGGAVPEPDAALSAAVGRGDPCWDVGGHCACSLYRAEPTDLDRIRRTAARRRWPAKLLARKLAAAGDWTGLDPAVRATVASLAERWGRAAVLVWWDDGKHRPTVGDALAVRPADLLADPAVVVPGRLVTVRPTRRPRPAATGLEPCDGSDNLC